MPSLRTVEAVALDEVLATPLRKRKGMPVSFIERGGRKHVLSRVGDDVIDLAPYIDTPTATRIHMSRFPERWRDQVLDFLLAYWRYGVPGSTVPKATTVVSRSTQLVKFIRFVDAQHLQSFSEIRPIHVTQYIQRSALGSRGSGDQHRRSPQGLAQTLTAIQLVWLLREKLAKAIRVAPFGENGTPGRAAGLSQRGPKHLATDYLSLEVASSLYDKCSALVRNAEHYLENVRQLEDLRHSLPANVTRADFSRARQTAFADMNGGLRQARSKVSEVRMACLILICLLSGVRSHEVLLLKRPCWRERDWHGQRLGIISGVTHKPRKKGSEYAEWLAPLELKKVIDVAARIAERPREQLRSEIGRLERLLKGKLSKASSAKAMARIQSATADLDRLFLTGVRRTKRTDPRKFTWDRANLAAAMREFSRSLHIERLHPHGLRRTFAVIVTHQCNGDLRYLKVQFKHWDIETTAQYAKYDRRDQELADEIAEEMIAQKAGLIAHWLTPGTPLAAPGGRHIATYRSNTMFKRMLADDPESLARSISIGLVIRPTGHSYCMSSGGALPCGGAGLYDALECGDCSNGVVEKKHLSIWELLGSQMLELEAISSGPVMVDLVQRSLKEIDDVLRPLGSSIDNVRKKFR